MNSQLYPLVSIVVTTKNEELNLRNCLESIALQDYPVKRRELIVVDNNSTDRTVEIARCYTGKVFNKGPERSAQRNFGMIKKSRGKYVLFLDADMILSPTVISRSVAKLEKENFLALYIPEVVLGNSFWSKVRRFERSFYDGTVVDCVRIIRRDIFKKVGGFDLRMTGQEDWDLDKKIRALGKVGLVDTYDWEEIHRRLEKVDYQQDLVPQLAVLSQKALIYHNESNFSIRRYVAKKGYYLEELFYIERWGRDDPDVRRQFGFIYRFLGVFVENGKWRRLIHHPFLASGMYFLRFLVGVRFLWANIKLYRQNNRRK